MESCRFLTSQLVPGAARGVAPVNVRLSQRADGRRGAASSHALGEGGGGGGPFLFFSGGGGFWAPPPPRLSPPPRGAGGWSVRRAGHCGQGLPSPKHGRLPAPTDVVLTAGRRPGNGIHACARPVRGSGEQGGASRRPRSCVRCNAGGAGQWCEHQIYLHRPRPSQQLPGLRALRRARANTARDRREATGRGGMAVRTPDPSRRSPPRPQDRNDAAGTFHPSQPTLHRPTLPHRMTSARHTHRQEPCPQPGAGST